MPSPMTPAGRLISGGVHLLTACGAVAALGALDAVADGRLRTAFAWLGVALVIDAVDGTLARASRVDLHWPAIDGALLDNLVDYATYALVPAWIVWREGLVPAGTGAAAAAAIAIAAGFQFAHRGAKSDDGHFRGFPSYWNLVALYLVALDVPPPAGLLVVATLAAASFAPLRFAYPTRMRRLRRTTLTLGAIWGAALAGIVAGLPTPSRWLTLASLVFPAYYLALGLLSSQSRPQPRSTP